MPYLGANGQAIDVVDAYAAGPSAGDGSDVGDVSNLQFFPTRAALNSFLDAQPPNTWTEIYGDSNANGPGGIGESYIFAGAVDPGWDPGFTPIFYAGQNPSFKFSADQLANVVYGHELSHLNLNGVPGNLGNKAGEKAAWIAGFKWAGLTGY
jgi:hypothetical protein